MMTQIKTSAVVSASSSRASRTRGAKALLRASAAAAAFSPLLLSGVALASPEYPDIVRDTLDMGCTPQCLICHTDNLGGSGTAKRPFVETLATKVSPPVAGNDNEGLAAGLRQLADAEAMGNGEDSDGDGVKDIAELLDLRDPSVPGEGEMCQLDVRYGCGARVEPRARLDLGGALMAGFCALGLGLMARRRWAR